MPGIHFRKIRNLKQIMTKTEQSYLNAYNLITGKTDYDRLADGGVFYLPENHEDPDLVISYYELMEEYEKCNEILKVIEND